MPACAVFGCFNQNGPVSYHRFPQNNELRRKWLLKCGRDVHLDCSSLRVCSDHFDDGDYERDMVGELMGLPTRKRLIKHSVPHKNLLKVKEEPIDDDDKTPTDESSSNFTSSALEYPELESSSSNENNHEAATHIMEQIGVLAANIEIPFPPNQSSTHHAPSSLPASQNWPGKYEFTVSFSPQEKNTKGVSWTYSKLKDKLYVGKDMSCPINFSANDIMPKDVVIRAMALFTSPDEISAVVHRCVNHSMDELRRGLVEAEHLIRCDSSMAQYVVDPVTQRHSVVVPFENPPVGQKFSTYIYKFACFGSCAGGPNRRPLMIIFTLERENKVLGRQKFDVKICACPGRDRKTEENLRPIIPRPSLKRKDLSELANPSDTLELSKHIGDSSTKKAKILPNKDGLYNITVDDPDCYAFLKQMKKFYEIDQVMKHYKKHLARCQRKRDERNN